MKEVKQDKANDISQYIDIRHNAPIGFLYEVGRHGLALLWELVTSFIFTFDGFGIQTKDGYIIKCKDQ